MINFYCIVVSCLTLTWKNLFHLFFQEEEERKRKEEQERKEHEEYLLLKENFIVEEEGVGETAEEVSVNPMRIPVRGTGIVA